MVFNFNLSEFLFQPLCDTISCLTLMTTEPHFQYLESAYQLHFYLCLKTHYLRPLFAGPELQATIADIAAEVSQRHGYHLLDSKCSMDHLRLLLSLKPEHTVSRAVQILKGNVSRQYSLAYANLLKLHHTKTPWAEGYFARSSGKADLETVRHYVAQQATHHGYRGEWTSALNYRNPRFRSPAFRFDHCICILNYQVVLVTKYRTPVFDERIAPNLFAYILTIGNKRGFAIDRMGLAPDHIHLVLEARPDVSIGSCVLSLVNNTQRWMEKHYCGVLKETKCWDVWQPSFYAGTVGEYSTAQIRQFLGKR